MKNIAIFASGSGSNAQKIMEHFEHHSQINVALVVCNNPRAKVMERAQAFNIPVLLVNKPEFQSDGMRESLAEYHIDFIVLAGFLWLIPTNLVQAYPNQIINIHPALLPKYGGKGMYGMHVHQAVVAAKEPKSGITIHFVNEHYDEGQIIAQFSCVLSETDTPEDVAQKIHILEHQNFSNIIEKVMLS